MPEDSTQTLDIPSADEMLARLNKVDPQKFDLKSVATELKGDKIWVSILAIPVSALTLVLFTLIGAFAFDQLILSFVLSAALLFWIGKMVDQYEQRFKHQARQLVIQRIAETEGEFGLIPHFKHFLPSKYRHLWQSLKKQNYIYIDQYIQAIVLLQHKLEPTKFSKIWYLTYPEINPENQTLYNEEYA